MISTAGAIDNDIKFAVSIGDLVSKTLYSMNLSNSAALKKLDAKTFMRRKCTFFNIKLPGKYTVNTKIGHPVFM